MEAARKVVGILESMGHEVLTNHLLREDTWEADRRIPPQSPTGSIIISTRSNLDFLVLAVGCVTNLYGISGLQKYALTMKTLSDAMRLRNHLIAHLEGADSDCCRVKEPLVTFVVAGGSFAGVETVAGINDFVRSALRNVRPDPALSEDGNQTGQPSLSCL